MLLDPAILLSDPTFTTTNNLASVFPHKRPLHYWSKSSLFANPVVSWILTDTGNIPVDRRSKDNQVLFKGTFDCLAKGEVVALFPEGTSYTEPRIMQVKDGASWSALEFAKWAREHKTHKKPLIIVPAGIVYTEKAKYRSRVIVEFAKPIILDEYAEEFMSDEPGKNKSAVKKLTARIEEELERITINAPDWETLYCARIARDMLWQGDKSISLDDYVLVSQTLVDLFSTPMLTSSYGSLRKALLTYYSLLQSTNLTNSTLSRLPLPDNLNPSQATTLPSRLSTLLILLSDTFGLIIRIPLFLLPFLIHAPALAAARHGANIAQEEETEAQNKVVFALLLLLCIYPSIFLFLWVIFRMSSTGAAIALAMTYALIMHYHRIVDSSYDQAKRLVAAWRVLLGVWMPKKWDLSISALTPYITPHVPPPSEFIDKKKIKSGTNTPAPSSPDAASEPTTPLLVSAKRPKRRVPTRQLIRHVLRARLEASKLLAMFFAELERSSSSKKQVRASTYLTALYGTSFSFSFSSPPPTQQQGDISPNGSSSPQAQGYRDAREVIGFLRDHGANIGQLRTPVEGDWAAVSSDGESFDHGSTDDDIVWVT
ncbi:hypothetical protein Clacol_000386 [Clathrus columnatus]|uniref:Phospholipid/glycerol acyltransferase domain-containing protein n=1 Tax=Clathrus columnatus TaxID=1419009 RepID=A0AAV4ZWL3_9AGAM|nr:hypothetical protein Clacol_000386 [Clathrus columnatus]